MLSDNYTPVPVPSMTRQFVLEGFNTLPNRNNEILKQNLVSFKLSTNNDTDWVATFTFEDDVNGLLTNTFNVLVGKLKRYEKATVRLAILDSSNNPVSHLNLDDATLSRAEFVLDYAASGSAKWVLELVVSEVHRTID